MEKLVISRNRIQKIPNTIGNLINLKWLDLSRNPLVELPPSIGQLKNLKNLHLQFC